MDKPLLVMIALLLAGSPAPTEANRAELIGIDNGSGKACAEPVVTSVADADTVRQSDLTFRASQEAATGIYLRSTIRPNAPLTRRR